MTPRRQFLVATDPRYREAAGLDAGPLLPCPHRGPQAGEAVCPSCGPGVRLKLFRCAALGECTVARRAGDTPCCRECVLRPGAESPPPLYRPGDPPAGVVVGLWGHQADRLAELQVAAIRHTCGAAPILLADDCSPVAERLEALAYRLGVDYEPNAYRLGHAGGDLSVFHKGIRWARMHGFRVLAKVSQRFVWTRRRWLMDGARDMLLSGLPLLGRRSVGAEPNPLRTEAVILDVAAWYDRLVLHDLRPRRLGYWTERAVHDALTRHLGGIYLPWQLLPEDRYGKHECAVWHCSHPPEAYHALARALGLSWDKGRIFTDGWQKTADYVMG